MNKKYHIRKLKALIKKDLLMNDFKSGLELMEIYPGTKVLSPLISFFCSSDKVLRWRAIDAAADVVNSMALDNMESARVVMRRFMWTLNEESGGVGWGAPEVMGQIMSLNTELANEYHKILFSYLDDHGNLLEYEPLQIGVLWGITKLSETRRGLAVKALEMTREYLKSSSPEARGLSLIISGNTSDKESREDIEALVYDSSEVEIYGGGKFNSIRIGQLAASVLKKI